MKLLIAYATKTGTTKACVDMMAEHFAYHDVTLFDLANGAPQIADFDAIIIGGPIRMNKMDARVKKFVEDNWTVLRDKLYALFLCCGFNENAEFYFSKNFTEDILEGSVFNTGVGGEMKLEKQKGMDKFITRMVLRHIKSHNQNFERDYDIQMPAILPDSIRLLADTVKRNYVAWLDNGRLEQRK